MVGMKPTVKVAFRELLAFRMDFVFVFLGLPLRILILWVLWDFLLQDPSNFPDLLPIQIFAFVIFNAFLQWTYAELDNAAIMERNIISGNAVMEMTLPLPFHQLHFFRLLPGQILVTAVGLIVFAVVNLTGIYAINLNFITGIGLVSSILLAIIINYFFASIIAALSIRFGWVSKLKWSFIQLFAFIGGLYVPLQVFPEVLQILVFINPISFMYDLPASIFVGAITIDSMLLRLVFSVLWVTIFYSIHRLLWKRSLEKFTAPGG